MNKKLALISMFTGFLIASNAQALPNIPPPNNPPTKAPEISISSSASAIALLSGVLLLVGEKRRSRRS